MGSNKSKLHGTIGLVLILAIGFGFGLLLMTQSRSTAGSAAHDEHGTVAEESMPGTDMSHTESAPALDVSTHDMATMPQDDSPLTLLATFFIINVSIIIAALIYKKVRSRRKVAVHRAQQVLEFEGGTK